jgi:Spy/CpxP family protein refolding chaperone
MMNPVDMQDAIVSRILNSPEVAERLGLTQEQISTIKASLDELSAEQKKLTSELEASGVEQAKLLTADSVDETALMAAVDKSSKIRGDLAKLRIKRLLIVKKALTVEQIQKVKDLVQERRKMFEERRKTFENRRGGEKPLGGGERKRDKPQSHDAEPAGGSML